MKFDKFLAILAYAYQAFATLALVFCIGYLLPVSDYGRYSLVVATAQAVAVFAFDWIRQAATRFCANMGRADAELRKQTILVTFFIASFALFLVGVLAVLLGVANRSEISLGIVVALMMGATDLQLVFLRVQGSFSKFSVLQTLRASFLLACSCLFAWWIGSSVGALLGLTVGYVLTFGLFVGVSPSWWRIRPAFARMELFKNMARYGTSAAAASVVGLQVPLLLRWVAKSVMPLEAFAGFSLAMDILQKPFALVTTAIGGVLSPAVIVFFEENPNAYSKKLKRLYEMQFWAVLLVLGGAVALLPDVSAIFVKAGLREGLLSSAVSVGLIFAIHTLIQTTIAIPGHLLKAGRRLVLNALVELGLVAVSLIPFAIFRFGHPFDWLWIVCLSVLAAGVYSLPLMRAVPCHRPIASLTIAPVVAFLVALNYFWVCGLTAFLALKLVWLAIICGLGLAIYRVASARWG